MRHIRIPFLVVALSLTLTGMAFAIDIPVITTWISDGGLNNVNAGFLAGTKIPGTTITGVGGGGVGRGDVLLAPLYDVRDLTDSNLSGAAGTTARSQQTLIAIVNTDHNFGVVGRLRFREWKRSIEVLDFDVCLTSNDVWVAQVSKQPTGGGIITAPAGNLYVSNIPNGNGDFICANLPVGGFAFKTTLILDGDTNAIARTEYGEFEFIGEEKFTTITASGTIVRFVAPANKDVGNTLEGTVFLVRPDVAISHQYNMTALANFAVDPLGIWNSPATNRPNLYSEVQGGPDPTAGPAFKNPGQGGFDNLEALLSKRFVDFQYVDQGVIGGFDPLDTFQTPMSTSLVITFPTKFFHYVHGGVYAATVAYPFMRPFTGSRETLGDQTRTGPGGVPAALPTEAVGEVVTCTIWDRFEHLLYPPTNPISPTTSLGCKLPWEVNVIGLYPVDASALSFPFPFRNNWFIPTASTTSAQTFWSGWGRIDLSPPVAGVYAPSGDTRGGFRQGAVNITFNFFNNFFDGYLGLPAIGVVMTEFYNGFLSGYYGNTVPWQYGVDWAIDWTAAFGSATGFNAGDPPNPAE